MLGTNDLLQGRRPKATAERMERFLTGLELARGKIPLFALPSRVPGGMGAGPNAHCRFPDLRRVLPDPCRAVERLPRPMTVCHFAEQGHRALAAGISPLKRIIPRHRAPAGGNHQWENRAAQSGAAAAPAGYGDISKSGRGLMERCPEH